MNPVARATAKANFLFNVAGAVLFFPFLTQFAHAMVTHAGDPGMAVALAHLVFNLTTALVFLVPLDWLAPRLQESLLGMRS